MAETNMILLKVFSYEEGEDGDAPMGSKGEVAKVVGET
jgi:hypothetical protein